MKRIKIKSIRIPKLKNKQSGIINFIDYKKTGFKILYIFMLIILFIFLFLALFPIFFLIVQSFKSVEELNDVNFHFWPENFDVTKVGDVWSKTNLTVYFVNSLLVTLGAVVSSIFFNGLLAYGVSIVKPKGAKVIYFLILGSYMIPGVLSIIPLFAMIAKMNLLNNYLPLMLSFGANVFYFINFYNYFSKIPTELIEAMRVDGSSDLGIFFRLILPLSGSIIGIIAIFAVSAAWGDYLLPSLVLQNDSNYTIMVKLFSLNDSRPAGFTNDMMLMCLLLSIIPQIVIFLVFQKKITGGSMDGGVKG